MPRQSAEALAAAQWRAGCVPPEPPKHLSREARTIWREIVQCRPADYFAPGSLHLLESFCTTIVACRAATAALHADPTSGELTSTYARLVTLACGLASKLRITVQAEVERHSRKITERRLPGSDLLGGHAARRSD